MFKPKLFLFFFVFIISSLSCVTTKTNPEQETSDQLEKQIKTDEVLKRFDQACPKKGEIVAEELVLEPKKINTSDKSDLKWGYYFACNKAHVLLVHNKKITDILTGSSIDQPTVNNIRNCNIGLAAQKYLSFGLIKSIPKDQKGKFKAEKFWYVDVKKKRFVLFTPKDKDCFNTP